MNAGDQGKAWWQSRTIIGAVAAIAATVLGAVLKTELPQEDVAEMLFAAATVAGSVLAIYGRVKASRPIVAGNAQRSTLNAERRSEEDK